ncbi:hypothetical protein [Sphingosinicella sp. BN140058]|uniref:hypothetical protein n=1 Tax=Sphingosinicella sp. BN140058 TaxID=1892855 RepID=UPI00101247B9|nr:hypothetical protein [Sphingosinicella sp. BN140058]QAY75450.1 hypothetical protein ETR14_02095 [Sphingosinicella sp. BN140058]
MKIALPFAAAGCLLLAAGCAAPGPFPSLAPRPAEALYASGDPERVPVPAPDRPAIASRIAEFAAAARAGDAAFGEAVAAARPIVGRAGGAGSDSWVAAQQAVSRAQTGRSATLRALADLDAFAIAQAAEGPLSAGDGERLQAATKALQALADRQQGQLAEFEQRLSR